MQGVLCYRIFSLMIVRSVRHRGLGRLFAADDPRELSPNLIGRVRNILAALMLADDLEYFISNAPTGWRVHRLSGNLQEEWSVSVSGNWQITFEEENGFIDRLNLEDYH